MMCLMSTLVKTNIAAAYILDVEGGEGSTVRYGKSVIPVSKMAAFKKPFSVLLYLKA